MTADNILSGVATQVNDAFDAQGIQTIVIEDPFMATDFGTTRMPSGLGERIHFIKLILLGEFCDPSI